MSYRFRLPILSEQVLSEIIYGMENQDVDYMLDLRTGTLYNPESGDGNEPSESDLISLPDWTSSDGYEVMVAFTNSCKDKELKEKLATELNSRQKGVFRRFRDGLSEDKENLEQWYDFKDRRMKSYIRSWYRERLSRNLDSLEEGDDAIDGELLSDFEVVQLDEPDNYCNGLLSTVCEGDPIKKKLFDAFCSKKAFIVKKNGISCGALIYETVEIFMAFGFFECRKAPWHFQYFQASFLVWLEAQLLQCRVFSLYAACSVSWWVVEAVVDP